MDCDAIALVSSPGSALRSNSSGLGAAISFHAPDRTARSGAQPNSTSGANDSAYSSRCGSAAREKAGERSMPSTSVIAVLSIRMTVGATSASVTASIRAS